MPEKLRLKWKSWFYGSIGAMIGGGSSAVVATVSAMTITPMDYDLNRRLPHTLQLFGTCFVLNAIVSLFLWLKQRPVPEIEPEDPA